MSIAKKNAVIGGCLLFSTIVSPAYPDGWDVHYPEGRCVLELAFTPFRRYNPVSEVNVSDQNNDCEFQVKQQAKDLLQFRIWAASGIYNTWVDKGDVYRLAPALSFISEPLLAVSARGPETKQTNTG